MVNPGAKFGYAFGEGGGFVGGIEVSITTWSEHDHFPFGFVFSADQTSTLSSVHLAVEVFYRFSGISFGPMYITERATSETDVALASTIFSGAMILPYYRVIYRPAHSNIHEVGSFFKLPIPLRPVSFGSIGG